MLDHELTPKQKNHVVLAIRAAGFRPTDFSWEEEPSRATTGRRPPFLVPALDHRSTGYAFAFDVDRMGRHYATFRPGLDGPTTHTNADDWENVKVYLAKWLLEVRENIEAPDLWAEAERERHLLEVGPSDIGDNTPFDESERVLIAESLTGLRELIVHTHDLQSQQLRELDARLDYVADAATRVGRFDWRNILLAQLVSLVFGAIIPQGALSTASRFIAHAIGHLFGGGGSPELPGGPPSMV